MSFTPLQWKNGIDPSNPGSFQLFMRQLADWANNVQNQLGLGGAQGPAGPPGPSAVSTNANNKATLGTDSLILVQGVAAGASASTHAQTVSGDDPQLSNARTPTAHQASHVTGSDIIPGASASAPGLVPARTGAVGTYLDVTGGWSIPAGGGAATPKVTDLGTITTDQTVDCTNAPRVFIRLSSSIVQTRVLTLTNLPQGTLVHIEVNATSTNAITLKIAATDPSAATYTCTATRATSENQFNMVTAGLAFSSSPIPPGILLGMTGFIGTSATPVLRFIAVL